MSLLQCNGIRLSFADRVLLDDVGFSIDEKSRISLAGANGCGKSTLLKILSGSIKAESGTIVQRTGARIRYLAQSGVLFRDCSIFEAADMAFEEFHDLERRVHDLGIELHRSAVGAKLDRLLHEHHDAQELLLQSGYHERSGRIASVLGGLGFKQNQLGNSVITLSGGWQMRLALAQVLLANPDVMLLDEPTNYLDLETREWLLDWMSHFQGAIVMVTHDRYLLDTAINQVAELYGGKLRVYPGSYSAYEARRKLELEQVIAAWKKQQDEIADLERFVERFKAKASKATQAQSRVKQLEKIDRIEIPDGIRTVHFDFPPAPSSGEDVIIMENLGKNYGSKQILSQLDCIIRRGEKVVLVGPNGAGKSTLMRMVSGEEVPSSGSLRLGHNVRPAYFAQEAETHLDLDKTILEELETYAPTEMIPQLRNILGSFLFQDDDVFKPISVLSGGEKNRVALVKMLLEPANLLILDEPTNHLDLTSKEILLDALKAFKGTVIFVSHDRYFIRDLATRVIALEPKDSAASQVISYPGDFSYYQWKIQQGSTNSPEEAGVSASSKQGLSALTDNQKNRIDSKKAKADIKRLEREESDVLERISRTESRISQINEAMASPEVYSSGEKVKSLRSELDQCEKELTSLQESWMLVAEELELLRSAD